MRYIIFAALIICTRESSTQFYLLLDSVTCYSLILDFVSILSYPVCARASLCGTREAPLRKRGRNTIAARFPSFHFVLPTRPHLACAYSRCAATLKTIAETLLSCSMPHLSLISIRSLVVLCTRRSSAATQCLSRKSVPLEQRNACLAAERPCSSAIKIRR